MADEHSYDSWGSASERFADGSICIGIDLGTTNSCIGMWHVERNHVKILKNAKDRKRTTPSVVRFNPESEHQYEVGHGAIAQETAPVGNTIRSIKRLMGQKYTSKAVEVAKSFGTYKIAATKQGSAAVQVVRAQKLVTVEPEEVSACILSDLKASAEVYFDNKRIDNVVITVPAYFNDSQRKATITSASMAGFKAIRLMNEPTAAAMAYGLFVAGTKMVVVFDFGGGTLDVSLMSIQDGRFEVLGIGGDTNLGGEDLNNVITDHLIELLHKHHDVPRAKLSMADMIQLKTQAEQAKIALSSDDSAEIELHDVAGVPKFKYTLTRHKFEQLGESIWKKCLRIVSSVLKEAEVEIADVDEVVMVGGSTRIPILRTKISEFFDGKELCMSVNADEVVCEGAAIQAAILSGMDRRVFRDVLMMDVIPLPIGLETHDGTMEVIIPKNSRIPVSLTKYFQTFEDNQRGLTVEVYEGEQKVAKENDHICYFNFVLPRDKIGRAGEFAHPVTFTMNASGVLQVQAGIHHDSEEKPMSKTAIYLMVAYIMALFAFYVFFRIYFAPERDVTLST